MITKYAAVERILDVRTSKDRLTYEYGDAPGTSLAKYAKLSKNEEKDGFLYVRARAISSRVNKNNDGWPASELISSYRTFIGRPVFVDHNNDDPKRTRGVIVDSKAHVDDEEKTSALDPYYSSAPENHKPPTWIELLIEVDGKTFPRLADAIRKEDIDAVSMGANIEKSVCSVCANEASTPDEYCKHIKQKGLTFEITSDTGERIRKKAYEDCYGVNFFEISFVFDPADETALISEKKGKVAAGLADLWKNRDIRNQQGDYSTWDDDLRARTLDFAGELMPHLNDVEAVIAAIRSDDENEALRAANLLSVSDSKGNPWRGMNAQDIVDAIKSGRNPQDITAKVAQSPAEIYSDPINNVQQSDDRNYTPQVDQITAPQKVDTLAPDHQCPVCKAADMTTDPDGIERCPVCGHVQEPEPLNNPDLSQARDVDLQQGVSDQKTPQGDPMVDTGGNSNIDNELDQIDIHPVSNPSVLQPMGATNSDITKERISEMFTTKIRTESKEEADKVLPVKGIRLEGKLGSRFGIHQGIYKAIKDAGLNVRVSYPAVRRADNSITLPVDNPIHNLFLAQESSHNLKVPMNEVPIVVEATDEKDAEKALAIITGATEKKPILPPGRKPSDEPQKQVIVDDQLEPVESKVEAAIKNGDKAVEVDGRKFVLMEIEDKKVEEDTKPEEKAEDADNVEAEGKDSEPEAKAASAEETESRLLLAFRLADLAVDMGLVEQENKMAYIAELETQSEEELTARESTLLSVKQAGLVKRASASKTSGLHKVPRLSHAAVPSMGNSKNTLEDVPIEAIFL